MSCPRCIGECCKAWISTQWTAALGLGSRPASCCCAPCADGDQAQPPLQRQLPAGACRPVIVGCGALPPAWVVCMPRPSCTAGLPTRSRVAPWATSVRAAALLTGEACASRVSSSSAGHTAGIQLGFAEVMLAVSASQSCRSRSWCCFVMFWDMRCKGGMLTCFSGQARAFVRSKQDRCEVECNVCQACQWSPNTVVESMFACSNEGL